MRELSEDDQVDVSDQFTGLLRFALDHGVTLIQDKGVLVPFTISVAQDDFKITAFSLPPVEAVASAKQHVARLTPDIEAYAIVFLGNIKLSGQPYKAVVVEGAERGHPHGYRIGQPLEMKGAPPQLQRAGEMVNLGLCDQLLT
jgi:hypothetical protein